MDPNARCKKRASSRACPRPSVRDIPTSESPDGDPEGFQLILGSLHSQVGEASELHLGGKKGNICQD